MKKNLNIDLDVDVQSSVSTLVIDASYEFEEFCDNISKDLIDL
jgi:hypothetical protein